MVTIRVYELHTGESGTIVTWSGCTIQFKGKVFGYRTEALESTNCHINYHTDLDKFRLFAEFRKIRGPVVMVVGSKDVGKSTICKTLLSNAVRVSPPRFTPMYIDLDPNGGYVSIPATIGAMVVNKPYVIGESFQPMIPLVYNYGHLDIKENMELYDLLISELSKMVLARMDNIPKVNASGIIINTSPLNKTSGHEYLLRIAKAFKVDNILMVGQQQRVHQLLIRDAPSTIKITRIEKSAGVLYKSANDELFMREKIISNYFFGIPSFPSDPYLISLKFSDVKIVKIGPLQQSVSNSSGTTERCFEIITVQPGMNINYNLLALSYAKTEKEIPQSNVLGFVWVEKVNLQEETLQMLSPVQSSYLPGRFMVLSDAQHFGFI